MRPNVKFLQYKVRSQIRDVMPTFMIAILMCAAMCSVNLMQFVNTYVVLIVKLIIEESYILACLISSIERLCYMYSKL